MARDPKIEVAAINIRIPSDRPRDYARLINTISGLKKGIRVYGDSYCAIREFNSANGLGIISKYTEIDIDGDWFDVEDFEAATPEKVEGITIPENLRPNHASFYFILNEDLHSLVFEVYSRSKGLSTRSFERYFKEVVQFDEITSIFGRVEADIVKSYSEVDQIVNATHLRELRLVIGRPNADDVSDNLAKIIEERLMEQNADEYEEVIKSKGKEDLIPNDRTKKLADIAADTGHLAAKILINGVVTERDTINKPLKEVSTHKGDISEQNAFLSLAAKILARITQHRAR